MAASDRGVAMVLLNSNPRPYPALPPMRELVSRGMVIPELIAWGSAPEAMRGVDALPLQRLAPFRLLAIDLDEASSPRALEAVWDRRALVVRSVASMPFCRVSSGLGDDAVAARIPLFERMLGETATPDRQDEFHRHHWPERRHISVLMDREDARTVSKTTVDVVRESGDSAAGVAVNMHYQPLAEACAGTGRAGGQAVVSEPRRV